MNERPSPKKYSTEEVANYLERWKISGKSKMLFCKENNINYMTFIGWSGKRKRKENKAVAHGFIPVPFQTSVFAEVFFRGGNKTVFHQSVPVEYFQSLLK